MSERREIVAYARSLIDTRFHHRARVPGHGIDCAGVLVLCARRCALVAQDFDLPPYGENPDKNLMVEWCDKFMGRRVAKADMQPGDALVMVTDKYPQHLGVIGNYKHGGLSLIHASNVANPPRVVESHLTWLPNQRFVAAYAFPGVDLWLA